MERCHIKLINDNELSTSGRARRRCRRQINIHVDNLRNRPLTDDDMEAIAACVPELYRRIDQESDLSSLTVVDEQLLRPPKDFTPAVHMNRPCECVYDRLSKEWRPVYQRYDRRTKRWRSAFRPEYRRCVCVQYDFPTKKFVLVRPPMKPPAVVTTQSNILFQEFSGSLVTPPHPDTLTPPFRCWNARSGNQHDLVEVNGQQLARVISGVSATWELGGRVLPRQWRVTVYRTDGQMQLSVFCSFPEEKVRRCLTFKDGATPTEHLPLQTIGRGPPRSMTGLRL